eukprot:1152091-Pelagomonas_calceolata.AAC.5
MTNLHMFTQQEGDHFCYSLCKSRTLPGKIEPHNNTTYKMIGVEFDTKSETPNTPVLLRILNKSTNIHTSTHRSLGHIALSEPTFPYRAQYSNVAIQCHEKNQN